MSKEKKPKKQIFTTGLWMGIWTRGQYDGLDLWMTVPGKVDPARFLWCTVVEAESADEAKQIGQAMLKAEKTQAAAA